MVILQPPKTGSGLTWLRSSACTYQGVFAGADI